MFIVRPEEENPSEQKNSRETAAFTHLYILSHGRPHGAICVHSGSRASDRRSGLRSAPLGRQLQAGRIVCQHCHIAQFFRIALQVSGGFSANTARIMLRVRHMINICFGGSLLQQTPSLRIGKIDGIPKAIVCPAAVQKSQMPVRRRIGIRRQVYRYAAGRNQKHIMLRPGIAARHVLHVLKFHSKRPGPKDAVIRSLRRRKKSR